MKFSIRIVEKQAIALGFIASEKECTHCLKMPNQPPQYCLEHAFEFHQEMFIHKGSFWRKFLQLAMLSHQCFQTAELFGESPYDQIVMHFGKAINADDPSQFSACVQRLQFLLRFFALPIFPERLRKSPGIYVG